MNWVIFTSHYLGQLTRWVCGYVQNSLNSHVLKMYKMYILRNTEAMNKEKMSIDYKFET